jgi:predicted GNAT family acetyltransferase
MTIEVRHNEKAHVFEATVDGHRCVLDYQLRGDVMTMTHTGVPSPVGGRGVAAELVRVGLAYAEEHHLRVVPACSYVAVYMRRHPETQGLLAT